MSAEILNRIPFAPDVAGLLSRLHVECDGDAAAVTAMADQAAAIARPKAACRLAYVDGRQGDTVVIGGVQFASRVLRVNLATAHRVFAYAATCGTELDDWARPMSDPLEQYWADAIKAAALGAAIAAVNRHVDERYHPGPSSHMNPGSLSDWPMEQQRPLFSLLGDAPAAVGVRLTDSFLMIPNKSVSGIRFETATNFESCHLCPREVCPGRRAPRDPTLFERKYQDKT